MGGFLHDYVVAERVGYSMNQSCSESFPNCPISFFDSLSEDAKDVTVSANKTGAFVGPKQSKTEYSEDDEHFEEQHKSLWKKHTFSVDNVL